MSGNLILGSLKNPRRCTRNKSLMFLIFNLELPLAQSWLNLWTSVVFPLPGRPSISKRVPLLRCVNTTSYSMLSLSAMMSSMLPCMVLRAYSPVLSIILSGLMRARLMYVLLPCGGQESAGISGWAQYLSARTSLKGDTLQYTTTSIGALDIELVSSDFLYCT